MKSMACLILFLLMFATALGENIGSVEYHLPAGHVKDWEIGNQIENKNGITIVYTPREAKQEEQFFGVNFSLCPTNVNDIGTLQSALAKQFSDMDLSMELLEKGIDNALIEWKASENGRERIHGWQRVFSVKKGTVVLSYQTDDLSKLEEARSKWLEALKAAKIAGN